MTNRGSRTNKTRKRVRESPKGRKSSPIGCGVELVWPGKNQELDRSAERAGVLCSLDVVEIAGEFEIDDAWRNKLILGDNRSAAASLLSRFAGKVDLIYIDPPFATGSDFNFSQRVGFEGDEGESGRVCGPRSSNFPEWRAYSDTWKQGLGSYLSMLAELVVLMRDLLGSMGSLMIHVDYRLNSHVRLLLDEHFGPECFMNEIIWHYRSGGVSKRFYPRKHDSIIWYGKTARPYFDPAAAAEPRNKCPECGCIRDRWNNLKKHVDADGRIYRTIKSGNRVYKYYDDEPVTVPDVWLGINHIQQKDPERSGYPTQKPEKLLRRIVETHCPPGGLVADFFCGSGTTLIAAEKLGRRWIGCDSSRFAIHTTRKRLLDPDVMDNKSTSNDPAKRPFEILEPDGMDRNPNPGVVFDSALKVVGKRNSNRVNVVLKDIAIPELEGLPEDVRARIRTWSDCIDYWAVDWEYDGTCFVNRWQSFRTPVKRSLALETPVHEYDSGGPHQIFIKVVDILGNESGRVLTWKAV